MDRGEHTFFLFTDDQILVKNRVCSSSDSKVVTFMDQKKWTFKSRTFRAYDVEYMGVQQSRMLLIAPGRSHEELYLTVVEGK